MHDGVSGAPFGRKECNFSHSLTETYNPPNGRSGSRLRENVSSDRIPSYCLPYEELFGALRSADAEAIISAPILSVNMTSGELLANMYTLTVDQLVLSVALGIVLGLAMAAQLSLRKACAMGSAGASAAAAGSGIAATLAASSTGILGCCGSALSGGVLALAGVSFTTASQIAEISPWIQIAMIAFFAFAYVRLSRRLRLLTAS